MSSIFILAAKNSVEALIKKHPELKLRTHYDQLEKPNQSLKVCRFIFV